jgi:hypothetical protein
LKAIDARGIDQFDALPTHESLASRDFNCGAGVVGNGDILSREPLEKYRFSDVGLANQHYAGCEGWYVVWEVSRVAVAIHRVRSVVSTY